MWFHTVVLSYVLGGKIVAKNNGKKRLQSLEAESLTYSRDIPEGVVEVGDLAHVPYGEHVVVAGRVTLSDNTGTFSKMGCFDSIKKTDVIIVEQLGSNGEFISLYLTRTQENEAKMNTIIHYGDIVMVRGIKQRSQRGDVLVADSITLLSKALGNVYDPNIDFRNKSNVGRYRHMQLIQEPDKLKTLRQCSRILKSLRQELYADGFDEVSLSLLQESFEAGHADPFVTYSVEKKRDMYLRLTSELLMWRMMIAGFSKVFEFGKSFRNQGASGAKIPQFNLLELYRSYVTPGDMEGLAQRLIQRALIDLYGSAVLPTSRGEIDCSGQWSTVNFRGEVVRMTGLDYDEQKPVEELALILDQAEIDRPTVLNRYTIATILYTYVMNRTNGPAFIRNLPAAQSPLYKLNKDGSTLDETLVVIAGRPAAMIVSPERDPAVVRERMEAQRAYRPDHERGINEDILDAMKLGLPPCRGMAIGLEHLFMLLLDAEDIRDVDPLPVF